MNILTAWTSAQRIIKLYACRDDSANQAANIYKSDYAVLLHLGCFSFSTKCDDSEVIDKEFSAIFINKDFDTALTEKPFKLTVNTESIII